MLVSVITLASCDKGCTGDPDAPSVSAQAQAALLAKYPAASNVRWQTKGGYVVADFSLAWHPRRRAAWGQRPFGMV